MDPFCIFEIQCNQSHAPRSTSVVGLHKPALTIFFEHIIILLYSVMLIIFILTLSSKRQPLHPYELNVMIINNNYFYLDAQKLCCAILFRMFIFIKCTWTGAEDNTGFCMLHNIIYNCTFAFSYISPTLYLMFLYRWDFLLIRF